MAPEFGVDVEARRLSALEQFGIMDTPAEPQFDEITRLAAAALGAPHCAISLVDDQRQWFKSRVGIDLCETPRDQAFCAHAVDGSVVSLRTRRIIIDGPEKPRQYILGLSEDVTEVRRAEERVLHLAHYDSLTGLRNRASLDTILDELVQTRTRMAVLSVDLDRFKAVNDQFGHLTGDDVLTAVGGRLAGLVRPGDVVARIGGDEFVIITIDDNPVQAARRIANAAVRALSEPFATSRAKVQIGASIGVVVAPDDGQTVYELRQGADLALYRAKSVGRGNICFFSREMGRGGAGSTRVGA